MNRSRTMTMPISAALMFLSLVVAGRAPAQPTTGRWSVEAGVTGAPVGPLDVVLFAGATKRITTTGPVEWNVGAAAYGIATVSRGDVVSILPYCPDYPRGCPGVNDHSGMRLPVMAGVTVRLVGLPWVFNRIIPEFGTGGYYARWKNLPYWDADRPPLLTGYRVYTVGLRVTKRTGVSIGATQFLNIRNRKDRPAGQVAVRVRFP
ncbi:MAG: hypothetical protein Q8K55_08890 [Gemmatimonadaceae bacterium]|nr:hypothetical protein [Gemmatimonadaceae bacterium]